jgi:hypothetical protein
MLQKRKLENFELGILLRPYSFLVAVDAAPASRLKATGV